jgi:predicted DNA-binding transcriptional regulator AlpA
VTTKKLKGDAIARRASSAVDLVEDVYADRFVRCKEVLQVTGLSRAQLYLKINAGTFPEPIPLDDEGEGRAVAWSFLSVRRWVQERKHNAPAAREARKAARAGKNLGGRPPGPKKKAGRPRAQEAA